jgi:hypothetical protein
MAKLILRIVKYVAYVAIGITCLSFIAIAGMSVLASHIS